MCFIFDKYCNMSTYNGELLNYHYGNIPLNILYKFHNIDKLLKGKIDKIYENPIHKCTCLLYLNTQLL